MTKAFDVVSHRFEEDMQQDKYLAFTIGSVSYGIEMQYIQEIGGIQDITATPYMPDHYKGIINLRGKIIPVIDVRRRFHMQQREYSDRTCIIFIHILDSDVGLIVDSVSEVLSILPDNRAEVPILGNRNSKYVQSVGRVGDSVILLLACEALIIDSVVEILNEIA